MKLALFNLLPRTLDIGRGYLDESRLDRKKMIMASSLITIETTSRIAFIKLSLYTQGGRP